MPDPVNVFVEGKPVPGGSKKFVGIAKKTGHAILVDDAGKRNKEWRQTVMYSVRQQYQGPQLDGPLAVDVEFLVSRPKNHYGTGKKTKDKLRALAPRHHTKRPDATKLWRAAEDALTGILWHDDAQIVSQRIEKKYSDRGHRTGMRLSVYQVTETNQAAEN